MAQLQTFNPLGAFIAGQQARQGLEAGKQQAAARDFNLQQQKVAAQRGDQEFAAQQQGQQMQFFNRASSALLKMDESQWPAALEQLAPSAQAVGVDMSQLDLSGLDRPTLERINMTSGEFVRNPQAMTSAMRERQSLLNDLSGAIDPKTEQLIPEDQMTAREKSAAMKLGMVARAQGSSALTIAQTPGATEDVAGSQAIIAGATESAKGESKLKWQPQITAAVKLAEKEANERGDVLTDLARMEAGLPGLKEVAKELKDLAPVATSTAGGRVWDTIVKESGFGATEGRTASAKFSAIIRNQVLPLLKPTFGGSFTVEEGNKLEATMGDVNASPEEKIAALEAFMDQKERNIRGAQRQLGVEPEAKDFDLEYDPATGIFK